MLCEYMSFTIKMMEKGEKTDRVSMFIKTRAKKTKNDDGQQVEVHDEEATAVIVSIMYFMYIYIYILIISIFLEFYKFHILNEVNKVHIIFYRINSMNIWRGYQKMNKMMLFAKKYLLK